jgi:hypothetical protein
VQNNEDLLQGYYCVAVGKETLLRAIAEVQLLNHITHVMRGLEREKSWIPTCPHPKYWGEIVSIEHV